MNEKSKLNRAMLVGLIHFQFNVQRNYPNELDQYLWRRVTPLRYNNSAPLAGRAKAGIHTGIGTSRKWHWMIVIQTHRHQPGPDPRPCTNRTRRRGYNLASSEASAIEIDWCIYDGLSSVRHRSIIWISDGLSLDNKCSCTIKASPEHTAWNYIYIFYHCQLITIL